jgi:hypothetical protein
MYSAGKAEHFTVIRPLIEVGRGSDEKARDGNGLIGMAGDSIVTRLSCRLIIKASSPGDVKFV